MWYAGTYFLVVFGVISSSLVVILVVIQQRCMKLAMMHCGPADEGGGVVEIRGGSQDDQYQETTVQLVLFGTNLILKDPRAYLIS